VSARELVALGTASQVPTRHRNHNGYLLRWDGDAILFDPGEGTQRQMVRYGVSASQLGRVCVTHFHGDHCLGLAGVIQRISLDEVPQEIPIHYPSSGQAYFERLRHASIFLDRSRILPAPLDEEGIVAVAPTYTLEARRLSHTVESWGYRLQEPDGLRMLPRKLAEAGVRGPMVRNLIEQGTISVGDRTVSLEEVSVPRPGQVFAFIMDTRFCAAAVGLAAGADLVVAESTYLAEHQQEATERGHMTARDAATIAREAGARRLVLTHFSQRYPRLEPFLEEAGAIHGDVIAVRDGDIVAVPPRREVQA
jgi:ribonuclease Z